jgi:hypothetical protein
MSTILSPITEIRALTFEPFPTKPVVGLKMVRVNNTLVGVDSKGIIYTNRVGAKAAYMGDPGNFNEVWSCVVKLRAVPASVIAEHTKIQKARSKARELQWKSKEILSAAEGAGITLTKVQREKLEKQAILQ